MGLRESFLDEIAKEAAPAPPDPTSRPPEALTAIVDRVWELPARARLPRATRAQRQDWAGRVFHEQPLLTSTCVLFLQGLAQSNYPRRPEVKADDLLELQGKERQVQRLIKGAERLWRTATDGALVQNGVLARLNGRVLRHVRDKMQTGPRLDREVLASRWDAVFLLLDRRRAAAEAGRRQIEKREAELLEQAEAAEGSQAVEEALGRLRALLATRNEGGRP